MTKYREIIRLKSLNFSERNIALSCSVSRNTVSKICKKANELNLVWLLDESMTDAALEKLLFPRDKSAMNKRMPDYAYIRKELIRNGVSKKLLWSEYCEDCRMAGEEPLMYSSSVTTSKRMKKNAVPLCISTGNLVNRSKWTGQGILHTSLTQIPVS